MTTRRWLVVVALAAVVRPGPGRGDGIVSTLHNLSVSGPGPVTATTETQVCVFCHTPHNSNPAGPLWNHQLSSGVTYIKYTSSTMVAYTSQSTAPDPNGASKLCLSCHDGTVALGAVQSRSTAIALQGGKTNMVLGDGGYLGTDLSNTHPISFVVTDQIVATNNSTNLSSLALNPVSAMRADPDVHLDGLDRVQCTSCHNPHSDANYASSGVHFYNKPQRPDPCLVCHVTAPTDMGPHLVTGAVAAAQTVSAGGAPATALAAVEGAAVAPAAGAGAGAGAAAPGVGGRASAHGNAGTLPLLCMSCHKSHTTPDGKRALLLGSDQDACYRCHGPGSLQEQREGRLAAGAKPVDLMTEFEKPSHHPIELPGAHKPNERTPETNPNARRHVLCVDCHDAHETLTRQSRPAGLRATPSPTRRFSTEAELCFVCHGPAANRPATQPDVSRQFASVSYHPVLGPGRGSRVPSLVAPLTTVSVIGCSDCHGNDDPGGPVGPHGSVYAPLLVRNYRREDLQPESPTGYDLCYRCHDRNSILADQSFLHRKHVVEQRAPCSACHSAHGADAPALVAFDPNIVQPSKQGLRAFSSSGSGAGTCSLSCHGHDHEASPYCAPGVPCPGTAQRAARPATFRPGPTPIPAAESLFPGWPGQ